MNTSTSIIKTAGEDLHQFSEEQQGFKNNRSKTDAIYIIRQLTEKAVEFNEPMYVCLIELTKAFSGRIYSSKDKKDN